MTEAHIDSKVEEFSQRNELIDSAENHVATDLKRFRRDSIISMFLGSATVYGANAMQYLSPVFDREAYDLVKGVIITASAVTLSMLYKTVVVDNIAINDSGNRLYEECVDMRNDHKP